MYKIFKNSILVLSAALMPILSYGQTYGSIMRELSKYQKTIELSSEDKSQKLVICPGYQARVMTSTATGDSGKSMGWVNIKHIASGLNTPHINNYGGEERIWYGPEGGQYALFFQKDEPFVFQNWQVPSIMDTEPYEIVKADKKVAAFTNHFKISNRAGFEFDIKIDRIIKILDSTVVHQLISLPANVHWVGYESENTVTNMGADAWSKEKGLFSIWTMGMFPANEKTITIIPCKGTEPKITSDYFEPLDKTRLAVNDSIIYFKTDGKYRSKFGLPYSFSKNKLGSYDTYNQILTIIIFNLPVQSQPYVSSGWKNHPFPYEGDVVNSYNDGPDGSMYELESSSPALALKSAEKYTHRQQTWHFQGKEADLKLIALKLLGTSLIETMPK